MIPLFKTQYSVGKSLLQPKRVVELAQEAGLKTLTVFEDSFYGFRELNRLCLEKELPLAFGIRLPVVSEKFDEKPSKLVFIAKDNEGVGAIKDLYSRTYQTEENLLKFSEVKDNLNRVHVAVPFYDSFVYNNVFHFGMSILDLEGVEHTFLEEDNKHPFDFQISRALKKMKVKTTKAKSIYYEDREQFEAFQMFKAVCERSHGKSPNFGNPNLNHFCSQEFCWESWKEKVFKPSVSK